MALPFEEVEGLPFETEQAKDTFFRDAVSLPLLGAELIGSIPGAIGTAGIALGGTIASGGDTTGVLDVARKVMDATTPSSMVRNAGSILKNLGATDVGGAMEQGVDAFRESTPYKRLLEHPFGALVHGARDAGTAGFDMLGAPKDFDTKEAAADIGELGLYALALGGLGRGGKRKPSAADIDAAKKAYEQSQGKTPPPQPTLPADGSLPFEQVEVPYSEYGPVKAQPSRPVPPVKELSPFEQRAQGLEEYGPLVEQPRPQYEGGIPYEDARIAPELREGLYDQMRDNTRTTEMRGERPTIDFPLRQEAYERDPYPYTLKEEYERHVKNGNNAKAQEVLAEAERYAREQYGMSAPDKFTGSLWADKPTALPVEKTVRPNLGVPPTAGRNRGPFEKSQNLNLGKFRQAGTVEFPGGKGKLGDSPDARFWRFLVKQFKTEPRLQFDRESELLGKPLLDAPKAAENYLNRVTDQTLMEEVDRRLVHQTKEKSLSPEQVETIYEKLTRNVLSEYLKGKTLQELIHRRILEQLANRRAEIFNTGQDPTSIGYERYQHNSLAGWTNKGKFKQGGMWNYGNDPAFRKFKDALPANLKSQAKALWKQIKTDEEKAAKKQQTVYQQEHQAKVLDNVYNKDWRDQVGPLQEKPIKEIKAQILKEQDPPITKGSLGRNIIPGGKIPAFGTQDTFMRYATDKIDWAFREAYAKVNELIFDKDKGLKTPFEKLSKDEQAAVMASIYAHEGIKDLSRADLIDLGFSDKEIAAAERFRQVDDGVFDMLNKARVEIGKKPFDRRTGHFPSRFRGDFVADVLDAEGVMVTRIGAPTRWGAEKIVEFMKEKHPEFTIGEISHEPMHKFKDSSAVNAGYQHLIKMLADEDPRVEALESTYKEWLQKEAFKVLGVRKHFWEKRGVKGFEGGKEWENARINAEEGLKSFMNYVDHASKWSELVVATKNIKELLADPDIAKARPHTKEWVEQYIDQALGRSSALGRHIDGITDFFAKHSGIGTSLQLKGVREVKKFGMAMSLGMGNAFFSTTQLIQTIQALPPMLLYLKGQGAQANMAVAALSGMYNGTMGILFGKNKLSPLMGDAWTFAKKHGIVEPQFLEDVRSATAHDTHKVVDFFVWQSMRFPEKVARTHAYMTYVDFLNNAGYPRDRLFKAAAYLTDMTMVDYRAQERARLYTHLGVIGNEFANAMTSFKHNQLGQMWMYGQRKSVSSLLTFAGILWLMTGLQGMPGREDFDTLIRGLNGTGLLSFRIPTIRESLFKFPDFVNFGPMSTSTGFDWSPKFSAGNVVPDSFFVMDFFGGAVEGAYNTAKNLDMPSAAGALAKTGPSWGKALGERYFEKEGIFQSPTELQGEYKRNTKDWTARFLGGRSLDESKARHQIRNIKEQDGFYETQRSKIINKAKRALFVGNKSKLEELAKDYVTAEGKPEEFASTLETTLTGQKLTASQRELLKSLGNEQRAKRVVEELRR